MEKREEREEREERGAAHALKGVTRNRRGGTSHKVLPAVVGVVGVQAAHCIGLCVALELDTGDPGAVGDCFGGNGADLPPAETTIATASSGTKRQSKQHISVVETRRKAGGND